jgi:hypothetical protein
VVIRLEAVLDAPEDRLRPAGHADLPLVEELELQGPKKLSATESKQSPMEPIEPSRPAAGGAARTRRVLGGFNRSSQDLDDGGFDGNDATAATGGAGVSGSGAVAGAADGGVAAGSCAVLGGNRAGATSENAALAIGVSSAVGTRCGELLRTYAHLLPADHDRARAVVQAAFASDCVTLVSRQVR